MPTRSQKRKRGTNTLQANTSPNCTSGLLYWPSAPLNVENSAVLDLGGKQWEAQVVLTGLDLIHTTSTNNQKERATSRRLNIKNEIEQRSAEAEALLTQRGAILAQLDQVRTSVLHRC